MLKQQTKKNLKFLSPLETIEFLARLRTQELPEIAKHFQISLRGAQYIRKKHSAYSDDDIDNAIRTIERRISTATKYTPVRDYQKEEQCQHTFCTLFLKCPFCTLIVGENELDKAIAILIKKKAEMVGKNVIEVKL